MTSLITPGAIDATFPIAGQDNDSNGFRENFSAIQSALSAAKSEIEDLQTKAVLVETLGETTETVANNLNGSSIANGIYSQLNGAVPNDGETTVTTSTQDIDLNNGPFQVFKIVGGDTTLRFTNWSIDPIQYSVVRVHLVSDENARVVTLSCENSGEVVYEVGSDWEADNEIAVNADGLTHTVFEAWSYNGDVVFVRSLGDFLTPPVA
jgi:hypothetical protein